MVKPIQNKNLPSEARAIDKKSHFDVTQEEQGREKNK